MIPSMCMEGFEKIQNSIVLNHITRIDVGSLSANVGIRHLATRFEQIRLMAKFICEDSKKAGSVSEHVRRCKVVSGVAGGKEQRDGSRNRVDEAIL